jgi:flavodoxin-like protein
MKAMVIYESQFGNTEAIARAVAEGLGAACEVTLADVSTVPSTAGQDLLVLGGPTHAFGLSRPRTREDAGRMATVRRGATEIGLREYLNLSPTLAGLAAATFDTRIDKPRLPGSAARKAAHQLRRLGCRMVAAPESFRVTGTLGPLLAGESDRARRWAEGIAAALRVDKHPV